MSLDVICIGGAAVDAKYIALGPLLDGTSNPVRAERGFGGVARNICETLSRLGVRAGLASAVGDDANGQALVAHLADLGADTSMIGVAAGRRTAEYAAILRDDGGLHLGVADMAIVDAFTVADLDRLQPRLAEAHWVFADANLSALVLTALIERAPGAPFQLAIDPVSVAKAVRLPRDLAGVDLLVLNRDEAAAMLGGRSEPADAARALRARGAASVVLTDGAGPVLVLAAEGCESVPTPAAAVVDVTGAGDALIAATLAGLLGGRPLADAVRAAVGVAAATVGSPSTVRADLSRSMLGPFEESAT